MQSPTATVRAIFSGDSPCVSCSRIGSPILAFRTPPLGSVHREPSIARTCVSGLLHATPRRDGDFPFHALGADGHQAVVQVRHDAGVVGKDPDALSDAKRLTLHDADDAVLLGETRDPAAAVEGQTG